MLTRVEGEAGKGFLVVIFPHAAGRAGPDDRELAGRGGVKLTWKGQTHFVLLDVADREVDADGIKARASCLVVKVTDGRTSRSSCPPGARRASPAAPSHRRARPSPSSETVSPGDSRSRPDSRLRAVRAAGAASNTN